MQLGWSALGLLLAAALADLAYVVHRLGARFVNEDQASVLGAARELVGLRLREPFFPGQHYGSYAEGLPAAVLLPAGVPPLTSLSWTLALLWFGGWVAVAVAAWGAGARGSALLAAGMPLLLGVYPVFYAATFATAVGRFLGVLAAVLLWRGGRRLVPVGVGLAALAVIADPSAVVPVVAGAALAAPAVLSAARAQPWRVVLCCLPAAGWWVWRRLFAAANPDHGLHAAPELDLSLTTVGEVLGRSGHYAQTFAFALVPGGSAVLAAGAAVLVACLLLGSPWVRTASVAVCAVTLAIAATPRALDDVSAFLPGARLFLSVPYAVVLLLCALEAQRPARLWWRAAAVVLVASAVAGVVRAPGQAQAVADAAPSAPVVPVVPVTDFEQRCRAADELVAAEQVQLLVFLGDRAAAYGCPLVAETSYETLLPEYERRTFRLYDEQSQVRARIAVVSTDAAICGAAAQAGWSCRLASAGLPATVVEAPGVPALEVVRRLGIAVRPFGRGCRPAEPVGCS